jgi:hypothetical protein
MSRNRIALSFDPVPYQEPDGRKTWAVRQRVVRPGYFLRQLISFHPTREDAETACFVAYRKAGVDV